MQTYAPYFLLPYGKAITIREPDTLIKRMAEVTSQLAAAELMQSVEGCEQYIVHEGKNDPDAVWVTELWKDEAAHKASLTMEGTKALIQRGMPMIAGFGEQIKLQPIGGKGL